MGNKKDRCKCGGIKSASAQHCRQCSVIGIAENLRRHQAEKIKTVCVDGRLEKVCPCGKVFYAASRKICGTCKMTRRKHKEATTAVEAVDEYVVPRVKAIRSAMYESWRTNSFGVAYMVGWRCKCGACCVKRECLLCERLAP